MKVKHPEAAEPARQQLNTPSSVSWGWKMLAIIMVANATNSAVQSTSQYLSPGALFWTLVTVLIAAGMMEYAFQRTYLPLVVWRLVAPVYAFYVAFSMDKPFRPEVPVVVAICATIFLIASVVAIARRARYLGVGRIPLGGRKPSLT